MASHWRTLLDWESQGGFVMPNLFVIAISLVLATMVGLFDFLFQTA